MIKKTWFAASVLALAAFGASAQTSINLASYQVTGTYSLDTLGGMGLEASAVTYARDRGTLFFVGDEGTGVVEISLTGQTLSSMAFSAWPSTTTHRDAEGLTYLGNGVLVVGEERLQDAFRFSYVANGSVDLSTSAWASVSNYTYNNLGMEGLSYDPRDGSFVAVKQDNNQVLFSGTLNFAVGGGTSNITELFNGASLFGLNSLSDVQTLSPIDALTGTAAANNLLVLSLDSKKLVEIDRSGNVLSFLDLSGLTTQPIEGVTVDENGTIYLVAEQGNELQSQLIVLSSVPEGDALVLACAGLGLMGWQRRRASRRG